MKISKETLETIMRATDWFFEQAAEDLASYADHAGRKTIDNSDAITLMKRYVGGSGHVLQGACCTIHSR